MNGLLIRVARRAVLIGCAALIGCDGEDPGPPPEPPQPYGRFEGEVEATWLEDGRRMRLRNDFAYVDPREKRWVAPGGTIVDGASIPRVFWSVIGGPFEGLYRNASVVHDVACDEKSEPWEDVHLMFYEACRCAGVSENKAKLMYWAVHHFGPRWRPVSEVREVNGKRVRVMRMVLDTPPQPDEEVVQRAEQYFARNNPSVAEIKELSLD